MTFDSDLHSYDQFLGGRLTVAQPKTGYRAGVDPVLLAASVPAGRGESVLELGCGVGVASLCLAARVPGLKITGVEIQPDAAILAAQNAQHNGCKFLPSIEKPAKTDNRPPIWMIYYPRVGWLWVAHAAARFHRQRRHAAGWRYG